mmetsp:Transcript_27676/g.84913  ORF Transcript_27676/g.84913 Transcript_27676/m.84913 type:complete len:416 (+) Transcript_27676:906-2153(+)
MVRSSAQERVSKILIDPSSAPHANAPGNAASTRIPTLSPVCSVSWHRRFEALQILMEPSSLPEANSNVLRRRRRRVGVSGVSWFGGTSSGIKKTSSSSSPGALSPGAPPKFCPPAAARSPSSSKSSSKDSAGGGWPAAASTAGGLGSSPTPSRPPAATPPRAWPPWSKSNTRPRSKASNALMTTEEWSPSVRRRDQSCVGSQTKTVPSSAAETRRPLTSQRARTVPSWSSSVFSQPPVSAFQTFTVESQLPDITLPAHTHSAATASAWPSLPSNSRDPAASRGGHAREVVFRFRASNRFLRKTACSSSRRSRRSRATSSSSPRAGASSSSSSSFLEAAASSGLESSSPPAFESSSSSSSMERTSGPRRRRTVSSRPAACRARCSKASKTRAWRFRVRMAGCGLTTSARKVASMRG